MVPKSIIKNIKRDLQLENDYKPYSTETELLHYKGEKQLICEYFI